MSSLILTQIEADALIALEKFHSQTQHYTFPQNGEKIVVPLASNDGRENFLLDVQRGRIALNKVTFQKRGRQTIVLVRLDIGGPPHRNPNDEEISCPHIHLYREGYGDKWAEPISSQYFSKPDDLSITLDDFMSFCNIVRRPIIQRGLFT